jgi:hypothetical protein
MAGDTVSLGGNTAPLRGRELVEEHNKLVDDLELLRAELVSTMEAVNAIIDAADTNIAAVAALTPMDPAAVEEPETLLAGKIDF